MRTKKITFEKKPVSGCFERYNLKTIGIHQKRDKCPQMENLPKINARRRIIFVNENSSYYKFRSCIVGKIVKLVRKTDVGWICEFVNDDDRIALNKAAGWSDRKIQYLFDCVKFKD